MNQYKLHDVLESMRLPNGAYVASTSDDYNYVWIRDVCYTVMPYLTSKCSRYEKAYHSLLTLLRKYEWKLDIHTKQKPVYLHEYIHSRYSKDLEEIPVEWGHAQNDAIGILLFGIGQGIQVGKPILRDKVDYRIVQKLVDYLECLEYWKNPDNGMWEENVEIHASSVGACVAGLKAVKTLVDVPQQLIHKGERTLDRLLPAESATKEVDLSLLSLIYPLRVVSRSTAIKILDRVTERLERERGILRYEGDQYYNDGSEAEWCFGFPWLGLCYGQIGQVDKMNEYWEKTMSITPENGKIPELFIGGTDIPNKNTPLAWSVSMTYQLLERMAQSEENVS
ncbi:glycoside hydrolase family 15 protein [Guptibacillus algicola]|uniref:glycoside hydrolase family 15 protein n=1 Tax=Guptibacillus algicola TaxID=225844 RepID=UPI001CD40E05|nr:glycoside hydrolase family 15 protein [Alkalihalobacillus algicola]MCA0988204.1 glycoside hydrolase family 15 protein [Alkalihalobacillus algicola]